MLRPPKLPVGAGVLMFVYTREPRWPPGEIGSPPGVAITDIAHRRAVKLVEENRLLLEAFAHTLLDKEVLERADIEKLVDTHRGTKEGRFVRRKSDAGHDARLAASERFVETGED